MVRTEYSLLTAPKARLTRFDVIEGTNDSPLAKQNHPAIAAFAEYKPIKLYLITMAKEKAELGVGTKLDRSPDFVSSMRKHGEERGTAFLPPWPSDSTGLVEWRKGHALDAIDRG